MSIALNFTSIPHDDEILFGEIESAAAGTLEAVAFNQYNQTVDVLLKDGTSGAIQTDVTNAVNNHSCPEQDFYDAVQTLLGGSPTASDVLTAISDFLEAKGFS